MEEQKIETEGKFALNTRLILFGRAIAVNWYLGITKMNHSISDRGSQVGLTLITSGKKIHGQEERVNLLEHKNQGERLMTLYHGKQSGKRLSVPKHFIEQAYYLLSKQGP